VAGWWAVVIWLRTGMFVPGERIARFRDKLLKMNGTLKFAFGLAVPALVFGFGIVGSCGRWSKLSPRQIDLRVAVSDIGHGWTSRNLPLGDTETAVSAVRDILNFDSYINREYSRAGVKFALYSAFWSSGSMPAQSVASHAPDQCWVLAGWTCLSWRSFVRPPVSAAGLGPLEERRFRSPDGAVVNVWYWHLQDGVSSGYGYRGNLVGYSSRWILDGIRQLFSGSPEQLVVRISSQQSIDEIATDPGFAQLLTELSELVRNGKEKY
jgi:hypothetical protein